MTPARSNGKHPGGRPSKYDPAYGPQLIAFMRAGGAVVTKPMVVSGGKDAPSEIVDHPLGRLPAFFEGFATKIGVAGVTLLEWCKAHPEFADAYKIAKQIQLEQMVAGGLAGTYQPACLIFALKNMHGWRDPEDQKAPAGPAPSHKFIFHLAGGQTRTLDASALLRAAPRAEPAQNGANGPEAGGDA